MLHLIETLTTIFPAVSDVVSTAIVVVASVVTVIVVILVIVLLEQLQVSVTRFWVQHFFRLFCHVLKTTLLSYFMKKAYS